MSDALKHAAIAYDAPATSSDEGLPLANGLMGALVWGDGQPVNISLDRTDLWDLRPVPEYAGPDYRWDNVAAMHRAGEHETLSTLLEAPYQRPAPTKIPAGRIELVLEGAYKTAELDLETATAQVVIGGVSVTVRVDAIRRAGVIETVGAPFEAKLVAPAFGSPPAGAPAPVMFDASVGHVWDLDYPPPDWHHEHGVQAFVQTGWDGFAFAIALIHHGTRAAWSIATTGDATDPLTHAIETARAALFDQDGAANHADWWTTYWSRTEVALPDPVLAGAYHRDLYKFGAAVRSDAPPVALQGPWTVDNGRLPPWKGDYHHDLNTQLSYWPSYAGNRLDGGLGFLNWLWDTRDACRDWTQTFYGVDGLNVPMTADLANRQIGGWRQYTHSVATSAWLAHHFWLHWRFSGDTDFLADRAYPWVREVAIFLDAISAELDANGHRRVALSSSPEINDNRPEAWFDTLTNYDNSCFRQALDAASKMAEALGLPMDAERWTRIAKDLPPLAHDESHGLLIAPDHALPATHRHFSHLLAIHPFGLIDPRRSKAERDIVTASIADVRAKGTGFWMGYSFPCWAALLARAGEGDAARDALLAYADGFLLKNSFHANGDFANKGYSQAIFRAFTLEGNFAALAAVHEMLLQSHNGPIHLFPAIPADWRDVHFTQLLAEGAITVSARVADGKLHSGCFTAKSARTVKVQFRSNVTPVTIALKAAEPLWLNTLELDMLNGED